MKIWCCLALLALQQLVPGWGGAGFAQSQSQQQSSMNLTMEHRHMLKELLPKNDSAGGRLPLELQKGAVLPASVQVRPLPESVRQRIPQISNHGYVLSDRALGLVDVQERRVVEIVEY
jgi:hypothetical protein